jgi:hypothetical protein
MIQNIPADSGGRRAEGGSEVLNRGSTFARPLRYADWTGAYNPRRFLAHSNRLKSI